MIATRPVPILDGDEALADDGRPARGRERLCAVTRAVRSERDLLRFVEAPDGRVVPDLKARLPGRGVWVSLDRRLVAEAARRNVFARALKRPVMVGPDLAAQAGGLLREAALGRLGLAVKAGQAVAGFAKVESALRAGAPGLVHATQAAADGRRKLRQAMGGRMPLVVDVFDEAELQLATGRPHVIHVAVLPGPAGASFLEAAARYRRYEGLDEAAEKADGDRHGPGLRHEFGREPGQNFDSGAAIDETPRRD